MAKKKKSAYAEAGVDIDVMMNSLKRIGKKVKATNTKGVVSELGSFGGLFKSPGKENLLVSSVDGVGTKLKVANMANVYSPHTALDAVIGGVNDWLADGVGDGEVSVLNPIVGTDAGQGRLVELKRPVKLKTLAQRIKKHLGLKTVRLASAPEDLPIQTVALCAGAGAGAFEGVQADCYLTGEMSHHNVLASTLSGSHVILCEHTNTERGYLPRFAKILRKALGNGVEIAISTKDSDPIVIG